VSAARLLCYQAGSLKDLGDPATVSATLLAKYFASRNAFKPPLTRSRYTVRTVVAMPTQRNACCETPRSWRSSREVLRYSKR
jgi:hypothetical protein